MGRWRTVFRSPHRRVLVRGDDGRDAKDWTETAFWAGLAALAIYMICIVVSRYWLWLMVAGAVYAAVVILPGGKKRIR